MEIQKKKPLSPEQLADCAALKEVFNRKKAELGLTQEKAAQHLGMNQGSFSHYLNGRNSINLQFALAVAKLLDVSVSDFAPRLGKALEEQGYRPPESYDEYRHDREGRPYFQDHMRGQANVIAFAYPVVPWGGERVKNPTGHGFSDEGELDLIASPEEAGINGFWLQMPGSSMNQSVAPSFPSGTFLLVNPEDRELEPGGFFLACTAHGEFAIRQLVREAGSDFLAPLNPSFPIIPLHPDWSVVGRVVDARMPGV
ncbi:LexA family transcriptional regulator [Pseudomonas sp. MWU12-2345]|uniref:LexA family transcriptional regulator n=1 Tax=Pseudomonas sp. MWU12-2345 TaxID=2928689 RepID=UPI00200C5F45|nr:LexA family transcriptional regulator [Pseudomonas sp. MWU12-2345]